jgi:hypothetical protein
MIVLEGRNVTEKAKLQLLQNRKLLVVATV